MLKISTRSLLALASLLTISMLQGCAETNGASSGSSDSGSSATATAAGTLVLETSSSSVTAGTTTVTINAKRTGGLTGEVSATYSTLDGSAVAGTDYTRTSGKLDWPNGDNSVKNISITLNSSETVTSARAFSVSLSAPTGGALLGSPARAIISITGARAAGNPAASSTTNPMGQTAAARLLLQGTMGPTLETLKSTAGQSYDDWFAAQASVAPSLSAAKYTSGDWSVLWWDNVVFGNDQLRQRMAFALSEIIVVSQNGGPLWLHNTGLVNYYDILVANGLGNFRTLLDKITISPTMGQFLSMMRNDKPNPITGAHADQNFAREVMQLFTVGLVKLNIDGSVMLDNDGHTIPTYGQADVENLANVLTGWSATDDKGDTTSESNWRYVHNETDAMVVYPTHHDTDAKTIIGGVAVPAHGTAASDLKIALDTLFNHPNVGPFIGRQLIQRLVTSNPSPAYVQRVATVFNNDGTGVRGNLLAVAKAILTDPEATNPGGDSYGKVREPMLRLTNLWRAFNAANPQGHAVEWTIENQGINIFGQYVLYSPTVFNFFVPDYQPSGPLSAANLVAPEMQTTNEATLVTTANTLQWQTYQYMDGSGKVHKGPDYDISNTIGPQNMLLHTADWESLAANPGSLIDQLNMVFMAGQMSSAMRSTLLDYANGAAASSPPVAPASMVVELTDLVINSPQYAVQR